MITSILFCWIGKKLDAPDWYYILVAISLCFRAFDAYRYATRERRKTAQNKKC